MHTIFPSPTSLSQSTKLINRRRSKGFTLIELIVVIAIIATLLGVGIGTMKNAAASKGVGTGAAIAQNVFNLARDTAKSRGGARLIIYADTSGSKADVRERHLRYLAVAVPKLKTKNLPSDPDEIEWRLTSKGISLPKSTYFNANLSGLSDGDKDKAIFPGSTTEKSCYYYEFNAEGGLTTSNTDSRFVIQAGRLNPGQDTPEIIKKRKKDAAGFIIRKNGRMSIFRSPNQIKDLAGELNF